MKTKDARRAYRQARRLKRTGSALWLGTPRALAGRPVTYPHGRAHA